MDRQNDKTDTTEDITFPQTTCMSSKYWCDTLVAPTSVGVFRNKINDQPFGFIQEQVLKNKIPTDSGIKIQSKIHFVIGFLMHYPHVK